MSVILINPYYTTAVEEVTLDAVSALSESSNRLTWTENVSGETGFSIKRSPGNADNFAEVGTVGAGVLTYDDTGISSGAYHYRIDAVGRSVKSNVVQGVLSNFTKEYRLTKASSETINLPHGADINFERTSTFSVALLVKWPATEVGQFSVLFSKTSGAGIGFVCYKDDTEKVYLNLRGTSQQWAVRGDTVMAADQWHLVVVTHNGSPGDLGNDWYVDGKLQTLSTVIANNLTTSILNTGALKLGGRDFSVLYSSLRVAGVWVWNRVIDINEAPDTLWNGGLPPQYAAAATGLVRHCTFNSDTYSASSYTVVDRVNSANNGTTTNMSGTELVDINSVDVPTPQDVTATPKSVSQITVFWKRCGPATYDVEVSSDGSTGWTVVADGIADNFYHHTVGAANTTRYYRIKAIGDGVESSYSSNASATTLESTYTDVTYYSTRKLGDNSYNFGLSVETLRVAPCGYYDSISNKTYFVYMSRAEVGYDMAPYAYFYDHENGSWSESAYIGLKERDIQDRHPMPAIIAADDGRLLVCYTNIHNGPFQVWRSDSAGNISSFTKVTELGTINDYPEFRKMSNGDIYIFCRFYGPGIAGIGYYKSTDDGATWGTLVQVMVYSNSVGRPYPTMPPQPNTVDRIHICVDIRNDSGGPFPGDPDKVGYWKDMGYMYSDDGLTWRNVNNSFSKQVISGGYITEAQWQTNFQFLDSVGTVDAGLAVSIVTPAGSVYITHYKDDGTYNVFYHNGTSWVTQPLTFPDVAPDFYSFAYQGIQVLRHISGTTFDIYCTKTGVIKRYRTTDSFATLTLEETEVLPNVGAKEYERGTITHNIYEATEPFLFYSLKVSVPTPLDTSPGAWSDIVLKKLA